MVVPIMLDTPDGLKGALKPGHEACPHLSFDGVEACCAVHDRPEYEGSPCWTYGNPDVDPDFEIKRGRPCAVGEAVLERGGLRKVHPDVRQVPLVGTFKILGKWPSADDGTA
jgi:hypothetical protein